MFTKTKFGVIGCSTIAKTSVIPAILSSSDISLEILGSRSTFKSKLFSKKFNCKKYGTYDDVLENPNVDVVYVSLPPSLLEKWSIRAAKAGKHVICEKPAGLSFDSACKMVKNCEKNDVRIMEGFSFLHHPQHKTMKNFLKQNKLGDLFSLNSKFGFHIKKSQETFRLNKKLGGGILNDVGCYIIKISTEIFQQLPTGIFCNLVFDKKSKIDVQGTIVLNFDDQKFSTGFISYKNSFQSTYDIWGSKGNLTVKRAFNLKKNLSGQIDIVKDNTSQKIVVKPANQSRLMLEKFAKSLAKTDKTFEIDLLNQAKILDYAKRSSKQNKFLTIR